MPVASAKTSGHNKLTTAAPKSKVINNPSRAAGTQSANEATNGILTPPKLASQWSKAKSKASSIPIVSFLVTLSKHTRAIARPTKLQIAIEQTVPKRKYQNPDAPRWAPEGSTLLAKM